MNFENFTITKREVLVCIAITLILIGLGFLISSIIVNKINENNEKYYKSLKINNDQEMFKYAITTNIGNTLAQGKVQAVEGVSIADIGGKYFKIKKVKERYTMHTRQVPHTVHTGKTTMTYYTTEEYWTWDYMGEEEFHTEKFNFLGVVFDYGIINFNNEKHKETKNVDYYTRYQYYITPFEFNGTLFTYINNNTINQNEFFINTNIETIIQEKEKSIEIFKRVFWIIWLIFIGLIDFVYMYLENNYLED